MKKEYHDLIYHATLAASSHNTQPWKFEVWNNRIIIHPDFNRILPVVDPDNHELFISLGCALENLVIAAGNYGYNPVVKLQTNADVYIEEPYISVELQTAGEKGKNSFLFEQLEVRQTTRNKYNGNKIPLRHIEELKAAAAQEDVSIVIITNPEVLDPVLDLVKEACITQYSKQDFIEELVHWIRFNRGKAAKWGDGMYSGVTGNPSLPSWLGKLVLGVSDSPEKEAEKHEELLRSSSAVAVFIAKRNDQKAWINVGRSFERFALTATGLGIHNAHANMVCEELLSRKKLARLLRLDRGEQPLLFVRLGYSEKMVYSYRRSIKEVMKEPELAIAPSEWFE